MATDQNSPEAIKAQADYDAALLAERAALAAYEVAMSAATDAAWHAYDMQSSDDEEAEFAAFVVSQDASVARTKAFDAWLEARNKTNEMYEDYVYYFLSPTLSALAK